MPLTRDFKETVQARARRDADFRKALLVEAAECLLADELDTGKSLLRDYINAVEGFGELGRRIHHDPKSLMRMLGPGGNPRASNLLEIIAHLQEREGVHLKVIAACVAGD